MLDLGTFGGSRSTAKSINIFGWVVGGANLPGDAEGHPFLYRGGKMQDLGTLGGDALAGGINNLGWVVARALPVTRLSTLFCTETAKCRILMIFSPLTLAGCFT